jgi:hypothetical protein
MRGPIVMRAIPSLASHLPGQSFYFGSSNPFQPIPWISLVWLDGSPIEHECFADAMPEIGPTMRQVKKYEENGTFVSECLSVHFWNAAPHYMHVFSQRRSLLWSHLFDKDKEFENIN